MREIKFRVWDKVLKEMNYLSLEDLCEDDYWYDGETSVWSVLNDCNDKNERFEIGQYTGLKDKNGVEIYEGDIVQWADIKMEIFWGEDIGCGYGFCWRPYGEEQFYHESMTGFVDEYEVIGNIYENKLKEEGK